VNQRDIGKQAVVEFIGPFALVFAGVGAIIATRGENLVAIALAHGLAIGLMITAVGHISGGHFNPAVTIAMLATGRIDAARAGVYVVAQILGATAAAGVLTAVYPDLGDLGRNVAGINNGVPAISPGIGVFSATLLEVVLTFFLVFVIFGVAVDPRTPKVIAGLAIGLTITLDIFAGGRPERGGDEPGTGARTGDRPAGLHERLGLDRRAGNRRADRRVPVPDGAALGGAGGAGRGPGGGEWSAGAGRGEGARGGAEAADKPAVAVSIDRCLWPAFGAGGRVLTPCPSPHAAGEGSTSATRRQAAVRDIQPVQWPT
jgi:glycerol uptake facilitator-like aquaporin